MVVSCAFGVVMTMVIMLVVTVRHYSLKQVRTCSPADLLMGVTLLLLR